MKKLYTLLAIIATIATFAQAPQGFNYQATVRNSTGALIVNQNVYFKFNLMLNSASSVPVFSETHYTPSDDLGQVNIVIGQGTATVGTFSTINWGAGNYYLGIELNTGSGYIAMGTTQLLSVPYALYANSSGNAPTSIPNLAAVLAVNNGANNLKISNLADPAAAQDAATKNYVDNAASANTTLPDGTIFVGNTTNQATSVALSGDVTITNTGAATIANNAITTAKIANANVTNGKLDKANIPLSGFGAATADVNLGTKKLTNVADPINAQDAVTKAFLLSKILELQNQINTLSNPNITNGTQVWSNTNLDVTTYRDGTPIPQVTDPTAWAALTTGAWCYYNNDLANGAIYGKLYNWYAVAGIHDAPSLNDPILRKQLAPIGWHIPSEDEWFKLITHLGGEAVAKGKMKTTGTSLWRSPNFDATNSSGFNGVPGGGRQGGNGIFYSVTNYGNWWGITEDDTLLNAYYRSITNGNSGVISGGSYDSKRNGYSVRLVRD